MNKNTLTAILMGFIVCLGLIVIILSIRLSLRPNTDETGSNEVSGVVVENATEQTQEPEVTEAPVEPEITTITVQMVRTTTAVNIRAEASADSAKLGSVEMGTEFEKLEELTDVGWTKIKYQDGEAYIKSDYLESFEAEVEAAPETEPETDSEADGTGDADGTDDTEVTE